MPVIFNIQAREIIDSRGNPTVEVDLFTEDFMTRASVPSGASTGIHEALELRDGGKRYSGKGVKKAIENITKIISPKIIGLDPCQQSFIDTLLITLDGTKNKSKLGANAILAVSIAVCKAGAKSKKIPLYRYIQYLTQARDLVIPKAYFNVLNGGVHAGNGLDFQEYMIVPQAESFGENLRMASETYSILKALLRKRYGIDATNVGDEGGFAPPLKDNEEPLKLILEAIDNSGYKGRIKIALDIAASEFFVKGKYLLGRKMSKGSDVKKLTGEQMGELYLKLLKKYPIVSIEDAFAQDDWKSWQQFMKRIDIQLVGDDLLVTNVQRMKKALEKDACNALLLKVNQIGTITEAIQAGKLAKGNGWGIMVSHRSGETEDPFIADFAVGLAAGQIKSGAPCRGERTCKYNQLLRIEEELSSG